MFGVGILIYCGELKSILNVVEAEKINSTPIDSKQTDFSGPAGKKDTKNNKLGRFYD